eukprot:jgi/Chlat1/7314/Chrsp58S06946
MATGVGGDADGRRSLQLSVSLPPHAVQALILFTAPFQHVATAATEVHGRLRSGLQAAAQHRRQQQEQQQRRRRQGRRRRAGPLASMTAGTGGTDVRLSDNHAQSQQPSGQNLFMIASASEQGKAVAQGAAIVRNMLAGAAAGVSVETALYPIDTIKTRLQAVAAGKPINLRGLYTGLPGNLVGVAPATAIFFGVYEPVKQALLKRLPEGQSFWAHFAAATSAGTAASLVRVPTEVIKQRLQTGQFTSAITAVKQIVAKEGTRGLYAGYGSFLLRDLPFDAIEFVAYEQLKLVYQRAKLGRELNGPELAGIGAGAGVVTAVLTTPLDVIKTRLMVQGTTGRYKGIVDCVQTILREEGASTFFSGVGARVMWIGIGGSIFFSVLEKAKTILAEQEAKKLELQR